MNINSNYQPILTHSTLYCHFVLQWHFLLSTLSNHDSTTLFNLSNCDCAILPLTLIIRQTLSPLLLVSCIKGFLHSHNKHNKLAKMMKIKGNKMWCNIKIWWISMINPLNHLSSPNIALLSWRWRWIHPQNIDLKTLLGLLCHS